MSNMKFPVLQTLKLCQKCGTVPTFHRNIRTLQTKFASGQRSELYWTLQWRHLLRLPKHTRILVSQFSTSPRVFSADEDGKKLAKQFKDDPEAREFLKEITQDFNNDQGIDSSSTGASILSEFKDETNTSSGSDSESESEKDSTKQASTPNITEKSEYIIMQEQKVTPVPLAQGKCSMDNRNTKAEIADPTLLEAMSRDADEHAFNALMLWETTVWDERCIEAKEKRERNLIFIVQQNLLGAKGRECDIHDVMQKYFSRLGYADVSVKNVKCIGRKWKNFLKFRVTLKDKETVEQLLKAKRGKSRMWISADLPAIYDRIEEHLEKETYIRNKISSARSESWRWKVTGKRLDWFMIERSWASTSEAQRLADELLARVNKFEEMGNARNKEMEARRKREKFLIFRHVKKSESSDRERSLLHDTSKVKDLFEALHLDYKNVKKITRRGISIVVELYNGEEVNFSKRLLHNSRWKWMDSVKVVTSATFLQRYIYALTQQVNFIREDIDLGKRFGSSL